MRDNLIFINFPETSENETPEQTEIVVKEFISDTLEITEDIPFHIVHRLRKRPDNKPRSIVAKFEKRKDRNRILKIANDKREVMKAQQRGIYEQLPKEIGDRRSELFPVFLREQRLKSDVKFSGDKLIVNGRRIYPSSLRQKLPVPDFDQPTIPNAPPFEPPTFQGHEQRQRLRPQ